jgi:hypothetical protein
MPRTYTCTRRSRIRRQRCRCPAKDTVVEVVTDGKVPGESRATRELRLGRLHFSSIRKVTEIGQMLPCKPHNRLPIILTLCRRYTAVVALPVGLYVPKNGVHVYWRNRWAILQ